MRMFYDCAVKMSESRKRTGLFIKHSHVKRIDKLRATSIRRFAKSDVIKDHNYNQFFVKKTAESPEAYTSTIELGIEGVQLKMSVSLMIAGVMVVEYDQAKAGSLFFGSVTAKAGI